MTFRIRQIYKLILLLSIIIVPYYIHRVRIDRILRQYTQKSNATHIIFTTHRKSLLETKDNFDSLLNKFTVPVLYKNIFFDKSFIEPISFLKIIKFHKYSALPPPIEH